MKKFISTVLTSMAVLGATGALTLAATDTRAQARGAAVRGHAPAVRSHSHSHGARVGVTIGVPFIASPGWYYPYP